MLLFEWLGHKAVLTFEPCQRERTNSEIRGTIPTANRLCLSVPNWILFGLRIRGELGEVNLLAPCTVDFLARLRFIYPCADAGYKPSLLAPALILTLQT